MIKWFLLIFSLMSSFLHADLNDELNKFFENAGASANVSSAEIYQGQKAGYMTGGGIVIRGRVMNTRPLTISMPKFDAGCGGIDIFNGGFTFINHEQLVATLKSIGSSAYGYAFLLGLDTISPAVGGVIKNLQTWSNHINTLNINSCETAQLALGSVWPKRTEASQEICRRLASQEGTFTNYIKARHDCAKEKDHNSVTNKQNQFNWFTRDEINIAWESIQKQPFLTSDNELSEFFMSLMGTVIFRQGESPIRYVSKIKDESFLQALIEGGKTTIYACSNLKSDKYCLTLTEVEKDFGKSKSWLSRVRDQLIQMQEKALSDKELSDDEKALLTKSRLPLYKIINVLTAHKKGVCSIDIYQVADIVALDLLMQFLSEAIEIVRDGARQFKNEELYGVDEINDFLDELHDVEKKVRYYETRSMQLFEREFLLIQKIQLIEEQLRAELCL